MSDKTGIAWTDATWNPVTGCSKVSPGCAHCYAETLALTRLAGKPGYPGLAWTPENAAANVVLHPDRLHIPSHWRKPRRIFVCSMGDLFHPDVPDEFIFRVLNEALMGNRRHVYQVLTKRPERMRDWFAENAHRFWHYHAPDEPKREYVTPDWPDSQLWLGTSIENDRFVGRADALRDTPAAVRFISAEPLLGPLPSLDLTGIDWLIIGGESGPGHRPMDPVWVRELRDRADGAGVAFFFKQWGGRTPKAGGRLLDGRTHDDAPD